MAANAMMASSSFDRVRSNQRPNGYLTVNSQPLTNFTVRTDGGNIIQGQINKIRVGEIYFPYDIPSVVRYQNDVLSVYVIQVDGATGTATVGDANVVFAPGFYTATELQAVITADLATMGAAFANLVCAVDVKTNAITFSNTGTWANPGTNYMYVIAAVPGSQQVTGAYNSNIWQVPTALWSLGFKSLYARVGNISQDWPISVLSVPPGPVLVPFGYPNVAPNPIFPSSAVFRAIVGTPYVGAYTQYIDICSPSLCQAQYVRDGNTNQTTIRRDLIARLYIASEISTYTTDPPGTRPFIIHRQFKNPKIMKWTAERSIDSIDLVLYDQYGQPMPDATPIAQVGAVPVEQTGYSGSRDYAITFLVDEHDKTLEPNDGILH